MSRVVEILRPTEYGVEKAARMPPRNPKLIPEKVPLDIAMMFEQLAMKALAAGVKRYSADAVLHQIRWENMVERGNLEFKANNNWSSKLARWFVANHPQHHGFFEFRPLREERAGD